MIFRLLILNCCLRVCLCLLSSADDPKLKTCLFGYMTDVQSWVDAFGGLHPTQSDVENAIDLSASVDPVPVLKQKITMFSTPSQYVKFLSLARCHLSRVPAIFQLQDNLNRFLCETLEYVSFYGNVFVGSASSGDHYIATFNATGTTEMNLGYQLQTQGANLWSSGFTAVNFPKLKELDLRACSIQVLGENLFRGMPNLEALYIGENEIWYIDSTAFLGLNNLIHLDFSRNQAFDENGIPKTLTSDTYVFQNLTKLVSLDLSFTKLTQKNLGILRSLGRSLKSLSLCDTGLNSLQDRIFYNTSLQLLDVSSNSGILSFNKVLQGLEDTLLILYAKEIGLATMEIFVNFSRLQILQLSYNEINSVPDKVISTMTNLYVLDLNKNRITSWFKPTYSSLPKLKFLSLRDNNINIITNMMIEDVMNVDYLALSGNFIVCNCYAKDFYKMAYKNEKLYNDTLLKMPKHHIYNNGYAYYNRLIKTREPVQLDNDENGDDEIEMSGRFRLVDFHSESYVCLLVPESRSVLFSQVTGCSALSRELDIENELAKGRNRLLALISLPCLLLPAGIMFFFRRRIRYFLITIRNSAMLSLINKKDIIDSDKIFNYDVFVSYCNEDRNWVLDHLLPHIEAECSISACLHERDFQVGLSILENIVSCMDRSKSIMLIISQRFLLSQWCQFEMHLAQHRLLETRREDLTLVLLEDIPRRLRPNTLHYLMLTKTYIVWPKEESERQIFWRRLKKTLISQRIKQTENVSLA